eukprot:11473096-Alexandrium_andersonii.AAC.1
MTTMWGGGGGTPLQVYLPGRRSFRAPGSAPAAGAEGEDGRPASRWPGRATPEQGGPRSPEWGSSSVRPEANAPPRRRPVSYT